jgi:hypothetical protein
MNGMGPILSTRSTSMLHKSSIVGTYVFLFFHACQMAQLGPGVDPALIPRSRGALMDFCSFSNYDRVSDPLTCRSSGPVTLLWLSHVMTA